LAAHLARVDDELAVLARERDAVALTRKEVTSEHQRLMEREGRLAEREAILKRRLDDKLNEKLREARTEIDRVVGTLKQKADQLAQQAEARVASRGPTLSTGEVGHLRAEARAAVGAIGDTLSADAKDIGAPAPLPGPPAVGDSVFVSSLNAQGIVRSVSGNQVEVEARGMRLRVRVADLRAPVARPSDPSAGRRDTSRVQVATAARDGGPTRDLVLIGSTVDDAIDRAAKFLDDALLGDERRLRFVHGHGTGRLRDGLTKFLRQHPLVANVSPAPEREGGQGATIVELKD
jgi:DNA mismatch repair protein MutS2